MAGPTPEWIEAIRAAVKHPKVFCKISHVVQDAVHGAKPYGISDSDACRTRLGMVWDAFGEDQVIDASNWPVSESVSDYETFQRIGLP